MHARQAVASFYDKELSSLKNATIPAREAKSSHVFHQYTLTLAQGVDRDKVRKELIDRGVPNMVYYPKAYAYAKRLQITKVYR